MRGRVAGALPCAWATGSVGTVGDVLEVRGLRKRYGSVVALDDVSLRVDDGQMVGFLGPNGSGKAPPMGGVMGVVAGDAGEVGWQGRPVTAADRRRFGYMPAERGMYPK